MKKLVRHTDPVLYKKAESVKKVDDSLCGLIDDMFEIMKQSGGIGLAAPQIGESLQLAVIEMPKDMDKSEKLVLINPRITSAYGSETAVEGCLSLPGISVGVKRFKDIVVETQDFTGKVISYKAGGLLARAIQHEIDHLNGILIISKLSPVRRFIAKKKITKRIPVE